MKDLFIVFLTKDPCDPFCDHLRLSLFLVFSVFLRGLYILRRNEKPVCRAIIGEDLTVSVVDRTALCLDGNLGRDLVKYLCLIFSVAQRLKHQYT